MLSPYRFRGRSQNEKTVLSGIIPGQYRFLRTGEVPHNRSGREKRLMGGVFRRESRPAVTRTMRGFDMEEIACYSYIDPADYPSKVRIGGETA